MLRLKINKKHLIPFSLPICMAGVVLTSMSCSNSKVDPNSSLESFDEYIELYYNDVKIVATDVAKNFEAKESAWTKDNIIDVFFEGLPKPKNGINVSVKSVECFPQEGAINIVYEYSKGDQSLDVTYRVEGFKKPTKPTETFDQLVERLYGNVSITLKPEGKEMTADPNLWDKSMITSQYFDGLPTSQNGINVKVAYVAADELNCSIDIHYKYSSNLDSEEEIVNKVYKVTGFKKPTSLYDIVNEVYQDVKITPTSEALKFTAEEKNWPIDKVTPDYFNGLPKPKNGINVSVESVECLPKEGVLFIQFKFTKNTQKLYRTYIVEGFKKVV